MTRLARPSVGLTLLLAACATADPPTPAPSRPSPAQASAPALGPAPARGSHGVDVSALPGWADENHVAALAAYAEVCRALAGRGGDLCELAVGLWEARAMPTPTHARRFFEDNFRAVPAVAPDGAPGRLTAYFAPEYQARRRRSAEFDTPLLPPGAGTGDRAAIEAGADPRQALAWMRAEELFFLQIQGSGYLTFEDGGRARAAFAGHNDRPFVGIARPMVERGLLPPDGTSGEAIRAWLAARRGPQARAVMALNPRYIFFRLDADDGGDPAGAAGVPLPARRAIAVDPAHWRYGDLVWIAADGGNLIGARASYHGLVTALDTGSAIRGPVRADLYLGRGEAAGEEAGAVRHPLRIWRLVPR